MKEGVVGWATYSRKVQRYDCIFTLDLSPALQLTHPGVPQASQLDLSQSKPGIFPQSRFSQCHQHLSNPSRSSDLKTWNHPGPFSSIPCIQSIIKYGELLPLPPHRCITTWQTFLQKYKSEHEPLLPQSLECLSVSFRGKPLTLRVRPRARGRGEGSQSI